MPKIIFSKNSKYGILNHLYFCPNFVFAGSALRHYSQCFVLFLIFCTQNFEDKYLPHELFLITRQTTKIRNAFANIMSTDIKPMCYLWQEDEGEELPHYL